MSEILNVSTIIHVYTVWEILDILLCKFTFAIKSNSNMLSPPRSTEVQVTGPLCRHYDRPESQDDTVHTIPASRHDPPECNSGRASGRHRVGYSVVSANTVGHYKSPADCAALPRQENALCLGLISSSG